MKRPGTAYRLSVVRSGYQRGVVLFVALIALVTLMLAAVGLTRSVDTTTVIAGNLAFRQAATSSADASAERASTWIRQIESSELKAGRNPTNPLFALNTTKAVAGYYSNADDAALPLLTEATWADGVASPEVEDASGNKTRYIIQRMCRSANQPATEENCLFNSGGVTTNRKVIPIPKCCGGTPQGSPMYRVTVRVVGPKNTISYVQAFIE